MRGLHISREIAHSPRQREVQFSHAAGVVRGKLNVDFAGTPVGK